MKRFIHNYDTIITIQKLLQAWQEFLHDKKNRKDVILFQARLMDNILNLFNDLKYKKYVHGGYTAFNISDPKPREIHKAIVKDRLLHHLIYQELYDYFDSTFIYDSYSCRKGKGTHKAIYRFESFIQKVSKNNTKTCWVLKCDIRKFFASIDHQTLKNILEKNIEDENIIWLFSQIIDSFETKDKQGVGLPLGNLTSQLLVNIYMNEFDQFMKRELKTNYYIRYADDFVILSESKEYLQSIKKEISDFLEVKLKLHLHPKKVFIKTIASGVDFLGWVHFPKYRILRTATKRRMLKKMKSNSKNETIQSYLGLLKHGNTYKLRKGIEISNF
jgi:retron-type reverse transcriptase